MKAEHLKNVVGVLQKFREHGLRIKKQKCEFLQPCVEYLGHNIDADGLHVLMSKVEAITNAPIPWRTHECPGAEVVFELLNYYGRFIPNLASILYPLNELLRKDVE